MTPPEFHRPERVDTIGEGARTLSVEANLRERELLAERFAVIEIVSLTATFEIFSDAAGITARGIVCGSVVQACSVTADPLAVMINEPVALRFVTGDVGSDDEIELSAEALDVIRYDGDTIDLGEAAAETLALALDPFPRGPRAAEVLRMSGVLNEEEAGPFAALSALKAQLSGKA